MANGNPYQQGSGKKKKKKNGAAQYSSQTVTGGVGGATAGPVYGQPVAAGPSGTQYPARGGPSGTVYGTPEVVSSDQAKSDLATYQIAGFQGTGTVPPPNMGGGVVGGATGQFYEDYGAPDPTMGGPHPSGPTTTQQGYNAGTAGGAQGQGPTYPSGTGQNGGPVYPQAVNVPGQPPAAGQQGYNAGNVGGAQSSGPTYSTGGGQTGGPVYPQAVNVPAQPAVATPQGYNAGTQQSNVQPQGAAALMEGYDASDPSGTGIGTQPQGYNAGYPSGTGANGQQGPSGTVYPATMQPRGGQQGQTDVVGTMPAGMQPRGGAGGQTTDAGLSDYIATTTGAGTNGQQGYDASDPTGTGVGTQPSGYDASDPTGAGTGGQQGPTGTVYPQTSTTQGQVHPGQVQPAATGSPEDAMGGQQPVSEPVYPGQVDPATGETVQPGQPPPAGGDKPLTTDVMGNMPPATDAIASMDNAAASGDAAPEDWEGDVYEWEPPENTITPQIAAQHQQMLDVMDGTAPVPGMDAVMADNQRRRNQREQQHEQQLAMRGHSNSTFADQSRTDMAIAENAAAAQLAQDTKAKYLHTNLPALEQMFGQGVTSRSQSLNEFFQFMDRQFRGDEADRANATKNMSLLMNLMGIQTTPISTAPGYSPGAPPPSLAENLGGITGNVWSAWAGSVE